MGLGSSGSLSELGRGLVPEHADSKRVNTKQNQVLRNRGALRIDLRRSPTALSLNPTSLVWFRLTLKKPDYYVTDEG